MSACVSSNATSKELTSSPCPIPLPNTSAQTQQRTGPCHARRRVLEAQNANAPELLDLLLTAWFPKNRPRLYKADSWEKMPKPHTHARAISNSYTLQSSGSSQPAVRDQYRAQTLTYTSSPRTYVSSKTATSISWKTMTTKKPPNPKPRSSTSSA
jgi:hypothetical protein